MSDTRKSDALSNFLLASAVVLAGMYGLEKYNRSALDDAEARALAIQVEGCEAHAVGQKGTALGLRCTNAEQAATAVSGVTGFEAIWIEADDKRYQCPIGVTSLSDCTNAQ